MKFTKIIYNDKNCIEHITHYMGNEASDTPKNTVYELSSITSPAEKHNLFVYVDNLRRYENDINSPKDYDFSDGKAIKFNYKIKNDSVVQLIVTEKIKG